MELTTEKHNDAILATVNASRIDASAALKFKDAMRTLVSQTPNRVILNLEQVDFIDSSGLGAVVSVMKLYQPDIKLDLCCLGETVGKVFSLTRMDQIFSIHKCTQSAINDRVAQ